MMIAGQMKLGKCCPQLNQCSVIVIYDIDDFRNDAYPIFPFFTIFMTLRYTLRGVLHLIRI